MEDGYGVLTDLIQARENIKRKYMELKQNDFDTEKFIRQNLEPVITPLENLVSINKYDNKTDHVNDIKDTSYNEKDYTSSEISSWFRSPNYDKIYGPKKLNSGKIKLGDSNIEFNTQKSLIHVNDNEFPLTNGIIQLLFSKDPEKFTEDDIQNYKSMLLLTSAHLNKKKNNLRTGSVKYKKVIASLFANGEGLTFTVQNNSLKSYDFWDDPNELVSKLKILLASKGAGNTGVENSINSIWQELLEAGVIKKIPHVKT